MKTLKAKSVSLYLEGLMILTYKQQEKLLEAAPLSCAGHRLKGVIHQRQLKKDGKPGEWLEVTDDLFERLDLQNFDTGRILIAPSPGVVPLGDAALSDSCTRVNNEEWGTFGCIPDLEKEFFEQGVTLKHDQLKPRLLISTGTFYSVLIPHHPWLPFPNHSNDEKVLQPIVESFRVNSEKLRCLRKTTNPGTSEDHITQGLVDARKRLGIRVYTAATFLKLKDSRILVCQLEKNGNYKTVLRIDSDQNYEIRMAIQNFSNQTEHESKEVDDDPIHTFHSLYFYKVINECIREQFLLSDEHKQRKYVKREKVEFPPTTGAGNPSCPIGRRLR